MSKLTSALWIWFAAAVLAAGTLVGGSVVAKTALHKPGAELPILAPPVQNASRIGPLAGSYAPIIKGVLPEVVSIQSSRMVKTDGSVQPFSNDPFFRQFFGGQRRFQAPQEQREQGLGSGVIVGTNGYILTNNHVVDGATDVKVNLNDKREFQAHVVGRDPKADVAVLKIDADHLPAIRLGDSSRVQVGDIVFAVGDPFGVGETATMGIVSAVNRSNVGIEDYEDFIQTDAPINPGNSGGALINAEGELIGINTAILSRSGGNQGIGFAVPVNLARREMDQIVETGHVTRGWLGATIQDTTPVLAKGFGLDKTEGVLISDVAADSPASRAGLKAGDVILSMNGQPVTSSADLRMRVSEAGPGASVPMTVWRAGSTINLIAKLGDLPSGSTATSAASTGESTMRGMQVENLTTDLREQLHVAPGTNGVAVSNVDPNGSAAAAGVQQGDVIEEVNHHPVMNVSEFQRDMSEAGNQPVLLRVMRNGMGLYLAIQSQ